MASTDSFPSTLQSLPHQGYPSPAEAPPHISLFTSESNARGVIVYQDIPEIPAASRGTAHEAPALPLQMGRLVALRNVEGVGVEHLAAAGFYELPRLLQGLMAL